MALALDIGSWICLTLGALLCLVGGIGTLRLPDVYARTHAASITDTLGAGLVLAGLALQAGPTLVTVKLAMIYGFMMFTGPAASHALVKAAYAQGVKAFGVPDDDDGEDDDGASGTGTGAGAGTASEGSAG